MDTTVKRYMMSYVSKEDTPRVLNEIAESVRVARVRLMKDVDWVNTDHSPSPTYRKLEALVGEISSLVEKESTRAKELRAQAEELIAEAEAIEFGVRN
jgi:hypothetical protein|tara:strand:+ start:641 stop:934 length:294 start_codon:yes stop_codon:yes gene_type:complete